jgi:hypothetical protein
MGMRFRNIIISPDVFGTHLSVTHRERNQRWIEEEARCRLIPGGHIIYL